MGYVKVLSNNSLTSANASFLNQGYEVILSLLIMQLGACENYLSDSMSLDLNLIRSVPINVKSFWELYISFID